MGLLVSNSIYSIKPKKGECKVRKYISKILWILLYDNDKRILHTTFETYSINIPASNWINWIPQLITQLLKDEGKYFVNLMCQIIRNYPLALYYPLRTLYLKLKTDEQAEKVKMMHLQQQQQQQQQQHHNDGQQDTTTPTTPSGLKAQTQPLPESLLRVSTLMHRQREIHPILFNTLEGLIDQLLILKVHWYEECLKNFKHTLNICYTIAFENSKDKPLANFTIDPFQIIWFKKSYKFYYELSMDKLRSVWTNNQNVKRLMAIISDPSYQQTRTKFLNDFNFPQQQATAGNIAQVNLFVFISKLRNWIELLEIQIRMLPKFQLLDERFRFVTQFCSSIADIEIPGEYLHSYTHSHMTSATHLGTSMTTNGSLTSGPNGSNTHYYVKISRFLPRYESVEKYNSYSKRIYIRGHNGKVYPFLISTELNFNDCRKEQHQIQLLRMINLYICKQKETAKRYLYFHIPRIVSLSADIRMVEDNCSSISLLDIYKNRMRTLSSIKSISALKQNQQQVTPILQLSEAGDLPLMRYYERLLTNNVCPQTKQFYIELYKHITNIFVPKTVIKEWALNTYSDSTDYFHFRKMFTVQLALYGLVEYAFHLTRLNPDQFYILQDTGVIQNIKLKFDINESNYEFNSDRPVYSRLTPNIIEFITSAGLHGILNSTKIATARCLIQPQYHLIWILKAILKDEIHAWHYKRVCFVCLFF
jgi:transformation/transcription domain-associated protein